MKRQLYLILVFFIILSSTLSFAQTKVGFILPLSGDSAFIGDDIQKGAELAMLESNGASLKLKLIYEDSQFSQAKNALLAQKLIAVDKVDVIVTLWDAADVVAPIAEKNNVLHIAIRWDPAIAEQYSKTLVFEPPYMNYGDREIEIIQKSGIKNIAVIDSSHKSQALLFNYIKPILDEKKIGLIERLTFSEGYDNSKSAILKLMAKKPELVLLHLFMPDLETVTKEILLLNAKQKISGFLDLLQNSNLRAKITMPFVAEMDFNKNFVERFKYQYKSEPVIRAPIAYDLIKIILKVLSSPQGLKSQKSFEVINIFLGESGLISYHHPGKLFLDCKIKIFKDNKVVDYSFK